jgi:hypothetical protein
MGAVAPGLPRAWEAKVGPKNYAAAGPNVPVALGRR